MAFLFQLVNIQIFPNDRLNILNQFWEFAKTNNLEEIAYKLSNNMLSSIEPNAENIVYGNQIATAYIVNDNLDMAMNWIELYENAKHNFPWEKEIISTAIKSAIKCIFTGIK